ncbi:MAG: hypothetical protein JWL61_5137 [Gemmatimonadetes bacterium]|nr:hypothetical protein [Gemmatimonadota bacterium]
MPDAPLLPELARSLRSLGAQRDASAEAAHAAIFVPLLDARARAGGADKATVLAALRGSALAARIEAQAVDAAVHGIEQPALARALTAQSAELMEPLHQALVALDGAASSALDNDAAWDEWVARLRAVFTRADVACRALATLIATRQTRSAAPRWFERTPR